MRDFCHAPDAVLRPMIFLPGTASALLGKDRTPGVSRPALLSSAAILAVSDVLLLRRILLRFVFAAFPIAAFLRSLVRRSVIVAEWHIYISRVALLCYMLLFFGVCCVGRVIMN